MITGVRGDDVLHRARQRYVVALLRRALPIDGRQTQTKISTNKQTTNIDRSIMRCRSYARQCGRSSCAVREPNRRVAAFCRVVRHTTINAARTDKSDHRCRTVYRSRRQPTAACRVPDPLRCYVARHIFSNKQSRNRKFVLDAARNSLPEETKTA